MARGIRTNLMSGMGDRFRWFAGLYVAADLGTVVFLTFFDGYVYTLWNWIIAIPVNFLLGSIWPIYWLILRPLLG